MKIHHQHPWRISLNQARKIQTRLSSKVILRSSPSLHSLNIIAAVDTAYSKTQRKLFAAVALFSFPELCCLSCFSVECGEAFPYLPGYLSFREIPCYIQIFKKINGDVDLILCDGQGYSHPRRFGLACHLGVLLDKPSIGVAKSRLIGTYDEPSKEKGAYSSLYDQGQGIGMVLRTRTNVKPLFVSPGHRIGFEDCRTVVLDCVGKYRIPEPLRYVHRYVTEIRMKAEN